MQTMRPEKATCHPHPKASSSSWAQQHTNESRTHFMADVYIQQNNGLQNCETKISQDFSRSQPRTDALASHELRSKMYICNTLKTGLKAYVYIYTKQEHAMGRGKSIEGAKPHAFVFQTLTRTIQDSHTQFSTKTSCISRVKDWERCIMLAQCN